MLYSLFRLFFPASCGGCSRPLFRGEEAICTNCINQLPRTHILHHGTHRAAKLFWGRQSPEYVLPFLSFNKSSLAKQLLHQLKYAGAEQVGVQLGQLFGQELVAAQHPVCQADLIVPVPLYKTKHRKRGYNQALLIAQGLGSATGIPVNDRLLIKIKKTDSQTRMSRWARWRNQKEIFALGKADIKQAKHLVLVDDVITTGSTALSCLEVLHTIPNVRVSIVSMAFAGA